MLSLSGIPSLHPQQEFEVIKHILLRERYLKQLHVACTNAKNHMTPEVVRFLDLLRIATVECVEAIDLWEQAQVDYPRVRPFYWNGVSYLVKMCTDVDELDTYEFLTTWLDFKLAGNPMILRPDMLQVSARSLTALDIIMMLPTALQIRARHACLCDYAMQADMTPDVGALYEIGGFVPPPVMESIALPPRWAWCCPVV